MTGINLRDLRPDFPPRAWKGGGLQAAEKPFRAVILSPFAVILRIDSPALISHHDSGRAGLQPRR